MFTVFDLETTGLSSMSHDIIQFAYISYTDDCMPIRAESLYFYYPGMSWTEEAYAVHQIPLDFLKQYADKFEENMIKMYAVLNRGNVCGHNAKAFDCVFAKNWLSRMGISKLEYRCIQDTMTAFKPITKRSKIKLIKLAELLGVTDEITARVAQSLFHDDIANQAHNAAFDTTRTGIITTIGIKKHLIDFSGSSTKSTPDTYDEDDIYADESGETVSKGRDPKGFFVKLEDDHYIYASFDPESDLSLPTEFDLRAVKNTARCLRGPFTKVGDHYEWRYGMSVIRLTPVTSNTYSVTIQLKDTMPVMDLYSMENREVFINAFNNSAPVWEV